MRENAASGDNLLVLGDFCESANAKDALQSATAATHVVFRIIRNCDAGGGRDLPQKCAERQPWVLGAERAAAAAGGLHVRIVELKAGTFQRFDVVDFGAFQIQQAGLVDEHA